MSQTAFKVPIARNEATPLPLRLKLQRESVFGLALGWEAAAILPPPGCAFRGRCPARRSLGSWNQSAHLLKKPLHQRSPGSCLPPRAAGSSFIAFLKFQISYLGCAPWSNRVASQQRGNSHQGKPAFPEPSLRRQFNRETPHPPTSILKECEVFVFTKRKWLVSYEIPSFLIPHPHPTILLLK